MQKVAVVTDSLACLTPEAVERHQITVIPLYLYFEGRAYRDGVDITPSQAYEMFQKNPQKFNTSAPSPGDCLQVFRRLGAQTDRIFCVSVSIGLSAVYSSLQVAREQAEQELPGLTVELLDSNTATPGEGFVALAAARAAQQGKGMEEVARAAREVKDKVRVIALLDTMRHVYRSGRIPKTVSNIGSALHVKVLLTVSRTVHVAGVVANREQGIRRMVKEMRDKLGRGPAHVAIMHAYAFEEAVKLRELIASQFTCRELCLTELSPLMGYATGTGTLGVAFYSAE